MYPFHLQKLRQNARMLRAGDYIPAHKIAYLHLERYGKPFILGTNSVSYPINQDREFKPATPLDRIDTNSHVVPKTMPVIP